MSARSPLDALRSYVRTTQLVLAAQILASVVAAGATGFMLLQFRPLVVERERLENAVAAADGKLKELRAQLQSAEDELKTVEAGRRQAEAKRDEALNELGKVQLAEAQLRDIVLAQREQVIASQKASADVVDQAIRSFHKNDFSAAIRAYQQALQVDPRNPYILDLKGYAEYKVGKLDDAIKSIRQSLSIDPTYVWGYFDLMRYQCAAGDYEAALKTLDDALTAATDGPIDPLFPKNRPNDLLTGPTGLKYFLEEANGGDGDGEFRRLCRPILRDLFSRIGG